MAALLNPTEQDKDRLVVSFQRSLACEASQMFAKGKAKAPSHDEILHAVACSAHDIFCKSKDNLWNGPSGDRAYGLALAVLTRRGVVKVTSEVA